MCRVLLWTLPSCSALTKLEFREKNERAMLHKGDDSSSRLVIVLVGPRLTSNLRGQVKHSIGRAYFSYVVGDRLDVIKSNKLG